MFGQEPSSCFGAESVAPPAPALPSALSSAPPTPPALLFLQQQQRPSPPPLGSRCTSPSSSELFSIIEEANSFAGLSPGFGLAPGALRLNGHSAPTYQ